jgi:FMN phosphatase YigB (HAD superfamily)
MVQPPVEVILYDLGNVILPFNHFQIAEKLSRYSRRDEFQEPKRLFSYLFDFENGAINDYEIGKVSSLEFFRCLKESLQLTLRFEAFVPIWNDIFIENGAVSKIVLSQKAKWKLGLVSNTNPLHFDYVLEKFPVLHIFDKWILSHEIGFKKPAIEIFQKAIEWASVIPEKILFIDDMEKHVEVAASLGMQSIHFISAERLREALDIRLQSNHPR